MAFLTEQVCQVGSRSIVDETDEIKKAGGIATTGTKRILDLVPTGIHDRCSVFLGSRDDVQDLIKFYREIPVESS